MYRDSRDRGGSSYSRSSGRVGSSSLSSSLSLATPSFSSITMLNKGRSSGGGGSSWGDSGFGSAGQQPWGSSGNDRGNIGGRGQQQMENVNASVYLDMDSAPTEFDAVTRVIGENGENLEYIRKTTGAQIQLQGRGTGIFNQKALHIYIEHNQTRGMERAEKLAGDLVKVVQEEYIQWQETNQQSRMGGSGGGNYGNSNQGNNQMYGNQNRGGRGADNYMSNTSQNYNAGSSNRGGGSGYQDNQRGGAVDNYSSSNQRNQDNYSAGGSGSRFNDGGRDSGNRNMGGSGYSRDAGASSSGGNHDRSGRGGNNWSDNNQDNYNRGGGSSDYNDRRGNNDNRAGNNRGGNDRGAPARTNTMARLDAAGNWHQQDSVQDNKRRGGNFNDGGRSGNSNQGRDTGMNRGYDRDNDRGMGRNQDRGMDRNQDRGMDRNMDRGMDRNQDRGNDRNMDRGNDRNMDRGMDRNQDRGMDRNMDNRGMDRNQDRGMDRGMDRNMDRGMDRNMDRSFDRGNNDRGQMDRGMDRGMDRSMDRGNDRGMDRSMDRGNDRNMDRGNDRGMDRGMDRDPGNMDRGNSRNMDRDMDRGMSRNMDPPPAPKQPKYCDICDDTFPNDDAYKTHCNGVYHAEMVLEIKARNQRARVSAAGGGGGGGVQQPPQTTGKPQRQINLEMWTPDCEGMAEQRWVYNQVAPLFERQLEQDILKKLQEYCRSVVSTDEILPDRSQQHMNNYCKLCKITYNDLRLHIGSNMHITYYILRQIQMGVDTFCNYYGDVPIANVDTDGGRVLALEALNWGPTLPAPSMGKPQLVERYKKLVVLSGPRNGYKCDLCRARCANMNFWVDHCTSVKHLKKMVSAMCALTREGFVREFPHTPVSPPYYAAACVAKLKDLQWHADIQVSNVQRVSQAYNTQGEWFDFRGPRGGNMGGGPRGAGGPSGPRPERSGGPGGNRPPPLMGAEAPRPRGGMEGSNQGQMRPRPGPGQPRPLMDEPVVPSMDTLSPADRDLVMQVSQITGLQDRTLVMSALEALRALDPNMIGALGSLSTQAMADVDPAMIETLLGAIGGGDAAAALAGGPPGRSPGGPPGRSPSGPMRGGPPKRRMPMGRGGGPVPIKKGRF